MEKIFNFIHIATSFKLAIHIPQALVHPLTMHLPTYSFSVCHLSLCVSVSVAVAVSVCVSVYLLCTVYARVDMC